MRGAGLARAPAVPRSERRRTTLAHPSCCRRGRGARWGWLGRARLHRKGRCTGVLARLKSRLMAYDDNYYKVFQGPSSPSLPSSNASREAGSTSMSCTSS